MVFSTVSYFCEMTCALHSYNCSEGVSCSPVSLAVTDSATVCTDEMLQEMSTTKNLANTLSSAVYVTPQLLIKPQCNKRTAVCK